jgi:hypothetical protein
MTFQPFQTIYVLPKDKGYRLKRIFTAMDSKGKQEKDFKGADAHLHTWKNVSSILLLSPKTRASCSPAIVQREGAIPLPQVIPRSSAGKPLTQEL